MARLKGKTPTLAILIWPIWAKPGFTRQPRKPKRAHLRVPAFKHHQNSTRTGVREGKRRAKFSAVRRGSGGDGEGQKNRQHTTAHNSTQQGNFKDVRVLPHPKFLPFLGRPLKDVCVLLHPKFSSILGRPNFFSCWKHFFCRRGGPKW